MIIAINGGRSDRGPDAVEFQFQAEHRAQIAVIVPIAGTGDTGDLVGGKTGEGD